VNEVDFSPDGRYLASASSDSTIRLWDASTGRTLRTFSGHTESVTSVSFSPDGHYLATGGEDEIVRLWEVSTGRALRTFSGHTVAVLSVSFSPDGHYLVSTSDHIRLWEVSSGRWLASLYSVGASDWVVVDPEGHFDGSEDGIRQTLHFVVDAPDGPRSIGLEELKERYYTPGLLGRVLGHNPERPRR
jgi:WD40 repeat protein